MLLADVAIFYNPADNFLYIIKASNDVLNIIKHCFQIASRNRISAKFFCRSTNRIKEPPPVSLPLKAQNAHFKSNSNRQGTVFKKNSQKARKVSFCDLNENVKMKKKLGTILTLSRS